MTLETFEADYRALIAESRSLILATTSAEGDAEASYAPFLLFENRYYVFVSQLAKHTGNMRRQRQASILFIQPEVAASNPFARQRLIFNCKIEEVERQQPLFEPLLDAMQQRFGDTVSLLRRLPDFHLLAMTPTQGQYTAGFGKAFEVNIETGMLSPLGI